MNQAGERNGTASQNGARGPRWRWRQDQLALSLRSILADFLGLAGTAACWGQPRSDNLDELALLEEELTHLRSACDQALEHVGVLLDHAAYENEPNALPRPERMDWIAQKALGRARRPRKAH